MLMDGVRKTIFKSMILLLESFLTYPVSGPRDKGPGTMDQGQGTRGWNQGQGPGTGVALSLVTGVAFWLWSQSGLLVTLSLVPVPGPWSLVPAPGPLSLFPGHWGR